jgi:hypothetical protein
MQTGSWLFGDSKMYYQYGTHSKHLQRRWCNPAQQTVALSKSNPVVLHFYAVVGKGFKSQLHFVPPTPPAGTKLRKHKQAFASRHFVQMLPDLKAELEGAQKYSARHPIVLDHAKQHTSKVSQAAIADQQLHLVSDFPAQSWDINIIENVWGQLSHELEQLPGRKPTTAYGWRKRIIRAWDNIKQSTIDKLVDDVKPRLAAIEKLHGAWCFTHVPK